MPSYATREALDLTTRSAPLRARTADEATRSIEVVLATETPVRVVDWDRCEIVEEVLRMDGLEDLPEQIPLLDSHGRYTCDDQLGSVRNLRVDNDELVLLARYYFADDERSLRTWRKARDGHLKDTSAGYSVREKVWVEPGARAEVNGKTYDRTDAKLRLCVSTRWKIREGSCTPIGADQQAKMRGAHVALATRRDAMPGDPNEAQDGALDTKPEQAVPERAVAEAPAQPSTGDTRAAAVTAERERVKYILALRAAATPQDLVDKAINEGWTKERTGLEFLQAERAGMKPAVPAGAPAVHDVTRHARDLNVIRCAIAQAAGVSVVPASDAFKRDHSGARREHYYKVMRQRTKLDKAGLERAATEADRFSDMSVVDLCRMVVEASGHSASHMGRHEVIRAAFAIEHEAQRASSSGSTPGIFSTSIHAMMLQTFLELEDTTQAWTSERDVANFQEFEDSALVKGGGLKRLPRGKAAEHRAQASSTERSRIYRFAEQWQFDEQDALDDNLNGLSETPREMSLEAMRLRPDMVYALLMSNPEMRDGNDLFDDTNHGNLKTSAALAVGTLQDVVDKMVIQREEGVNLNLQPKHLIVPPKLIWTARQLIRSAEVRVSVTGLASTSAASTEAHGTYNSLQEAGLSIVSDARLQNGVTDPVTDAVLPGSSSTWFLAGDAVMARTIAVAFLRGTGRAPSIRSFMLERGRYGVGFDIKHDIGVIARSWHGLQKATA